MNEFGFGPKPSHAMVACAVDFRFPRCSIGIWSPASRAVEVFAGSTVPSEKYIAAARRKKGAGANQLLTSYIAFRKGKHPQNASKSSHPGFVQALEFAHQRSADDLDYDDKDEVFVDWPGDNLHCAFCQSSAQRFDASAGCQVVVGAARRTMPDGSVHGEDGGAWARFRGDAYASGQARFRYILLTGRDAEAAARAPANTLPARLRFGSTGDLVKVVQGKLRERHHEVDAPRGTFGRKTLLAVIAHQRRVGFKPDGIVGPMTAESLGLGGSWPRY